MATLAAERFRGLDCHRVEVGGDSLLVAEHGAHALSWVSGGRERLYLSPAAKFDGGSAIRGGVPVCWPQFNQRGPGPKHGFVRNLSWRLAASALLEDRASVEFRLQGSEQTRAVWPHEFELALRFELQPGRLRLTLTATNAGGEPFSFGGALHSYFACYDVERARLDGLQGRPEWDALTDHHSVAQAPRFDSEFDCVYSAPAAPLTLREDSHALRISQSDSWAETVVWNPHAALCAQLADMPADGWRRMLCVEAAQVYRPVELEPGAAWSGWQQLELA